MEGKEDISFDLKDSVHGKNCLYVLFSFKFQYDNQKILRLLFHVSILKCIVYIKHIEVRCTRYEIKPTKQPNQRYENNNNNKKKIIKVVNNCTIHYYYVYMSIETFHLLQDKL